MPTNDHKINQPLNPEHGVRDAESPGYETTDVNVSGVAVFLAGLFGSVLIFFVFCFVLGKVINGAFEKEDGPPNKWSQFSSFSGAEANHGKRQDFSSDLEIRQQQLEQVTQAFPLPRLSIDDGEQETADLHTREDLLLSHYSVSPGENGNIRIPITRAMELIAQRGLPVSAPSANATPMFGDAKPEIQAPLTTGFARTGFEQAVIAEREQKLAYRRAEGGETLGPDSLQ